MKVRLTEPLRQGVTDAMLKRGRVFKVLRVELAGEASAYWCRLDTGAIRIPHYSAEQVPENEETRAG